MRGGRSLCIRFCENMHKTDYFEAWHSRRKNNKPAAGQAVLRVY